MTRASSRVVFAGLSSLVVSTAAGVTSPAPNPAQDEPRRVTILLELHQSPAIEHWQPPGEEPAEAVAQRVAVTRHHLELLEAEQQQIRTTLSALPGVEVMYPLQRLFNGLAVSVPESQLAALGSLPGVKAVHPLPLLEADLVSTAPLIRAPQLWQSGLTGRQIRIGIIDSGVDYLHRAFGGSGDYTGHVFDDQVVPWTTKVAGGWDFVGDEYNGTNTARPDGDPMDCNGHGTHVAGIAAGYGVTAAGDPYLGPWGEGTDLESLLIGPGVAPEAVIYALKVFGCSGSTGYAAAALEWALDPNRDGNFSDRLDVVNLSLGSAFGAPGGVYATIADNAARAGMIIVASAGNSGDTHFITGSPASADRVISVASSVDATSFMSGVEITAPPAVAGRYPATEASFGPNMAREGARSGALVYASGNPRGCSAYTGAAAAALVGNLALVDRGDCTFALKVRNAQNAGARGVLVINNVAGEPIVMGASEADAQGIVIPSMMISLDDGDRLKMAVAQGTVTAVLSADHRGRVRVVAPETTDTISSFSSRGPRLGDLALKPDIAAPGATVFAPEARSSRAGRSLSGTSMAAPQVAGGMALLRQRHPTWSVEELKALVMNTATPTVWVNPGQSGPQHGTPRAGAGRLNLEAAIAAQVIAYADNPAAPGRVGVSFGSPEVVVRHRETRTVRVVNKGSAPVSLALAWQSTVEQPGVEIAPAVESLDLPPNSTAFLEIVLTATASRMGHRRGPDLSPSQAGAVRAWLAEVSGHLLLSPTGGGTALRVPVYAAPRRRATLLARQGTLAPAPGTGTLTLALAGQDLSGAGHPPAAVTPLEWQYQGSSGSNLVYAGLATDFPDRPLSQALVAFGVALAQPWTTPHRTVVSVEIDTNGDGSADWRLANGDAATAANSAASPADVFLSRLCRAGSDTTCPGSFPLNGAAAEERDTAPFLNDVMVLYARVAELQLAGSTIRWRITAAGTTTPWLSYDLARPGVRLAGGAREHGFLLSARQGAEIPLAYNTARLEGVDSRGVLLLHHHNVEGWRAQRIPVSPGGCALTCDATVGELAALGAPVRFTARIEASGCSEPPGVVWESGDGSPAQMGSEVTHRFAAPGSFRWWMHASTGAATCQRSGVVTVVDSLPRPPRPAVRAGR